MKITGSCFCQKCNSLINWEYIIPQKISTSTFAVEVENKNLHHPNKIKQIDNETYLFNVRCRNCDYLNKFEVKSKNRL